MNDDLQLVRQYLANGSESAFETLVSRHIHLVYSAALRQVGNVQLADKVTELRRWSREFHQNLLEPHAGPTGHLVDRAAI
jgi:hypothetical protein